MTFIWPWVLVSLLTVPLCALLYRQAQQLRQRDALRLGASGLARDIGTRPLGRRRNLPPALFLPGIVLLLVAAARPQVVLAVPRMEGIVMLVFDVSASMAADDLVPSRMDATKQAALAFVERRPRNIKIGVVAFSDGGLVVQPPTDDDLALAATIDRLVPQSGTSLGQGILVALNALSSVPDASESPTDGAQSPPTPAPVSRGAFKPAVIVLLTDGENTLAPDPLEAAQTAIEQGVRIYTVGIGSSEGATVEIDGFNVFTLLDEDTLKEIALVTEGDYFRVQNAEDFRVVYDNVDTKLVFKAEETEITSILAGASILVLSIGGALSLLWFGRVP